MKTSSRASGNVAPSPSVPADGMQELPPGTAAGPAIVGIGASAGGLEAMILFFKDMPTDSGAAFVVVQHLDPTRKDFLVELLQRATAMPVLPARDRQRALPGHVYVIPPNCDLTIRHGAIALNVPTAPHGQGLPIDLFLRSLAEDRRSGALAVILSGMGADGTLGLRAIKEGGGAIFVQDPATAKFDGMPRSAVGTGLADLVAAPGELACAVARRLAQLPAPDHGPDHGPDAAEAARGAGDGEAIEAIVKILRAQSGHDFSLYKKSTVERRIERRMGLHRIATLDDYVAYLRANAQESRLLFKELLIGVTRFFRDPAVWVQLETEVIPALFAANPNGAALRAWAPACSTGEEAYSLAIVFREALEKCKPGAQFSLQIFATDLDNDAIDRARSGIYPAKIAADVSAARLRRYFVETDAGYMVGKEIRAMVIFAPQNLVMDPPFTKLDLLTCRNLLIYLESDLQERVLPLFHYSLNPGGTLMLGSAETVGTSADLFAAWPGKTRLYQRKENPLRTTAPAFPASIQGAARQGGGKAVQAARAGQASAPNLQELADTLLLQRFSPPAVLATDQGDIVYISGKTGRYLEPAAGKANMNIFAMARAGLGAALGEAFAKVLRERGAHHMKRIRVGAENSALQVDLEVLYLNEPAALRGMVLTVFSEPPALQGKVARHGKHGGAQTDRLDAMAQEVQLSRGELQNARAEMQTSREELKSTNEELQSTNEELQSTNEELTTSKEEMQSMNEELQTVNHELSAKLDELSQASDDMKNLLNSTDIATLFLDEQMRIRRFTNRVTSIVKLIPSDAGRPITDLASMIDYPSLAEDAREVLRTLAFHEVQAGGRDGRWYTVRIMPYRTQDNRIDGVVITFIDISAAKTLEQALRASDGRRLRQMFEHAPLAMACQRLIVEDGVALDAQFLEVNDAFAALTGQASLVGKRQSALPGASWLGDPALFASAARVGLGGAPERINCNDGVGGDPLACTLYAPEPGCVVIMVDTARVGAAGAAA